MTGAEGEIATLFLAGLAGYLIGSTPVGALLAKAFGLGDLRAVGSGNIGASNVLRTGNRLAALLTLVLDAAKGAVPALVAAHVWPGGVEAGAAAGLGAFLGHCFSIYLGFWGGKGVATGFGAFLAWRWEIAALCALVWLATALATKRSSAASLATTAAALILFPAFGEWTLLAFVAPMAAVLVWRHRGNIDRLLKGEEPKIRLRRDAGEKA